MTSYKDFFSSNLSAEEIASLIETIDDFCNQSTQLYWEGSNGNLFKIPEIALKAPNALRSAALFSASY